MGGKILNFKVNKDSSSVFVPSASYKMEESTKYILYEKVESIIERLIQFSMV